jgi:hypothetical protein
MLYPSGGPAVRIDDALYRVRDDLLLRSPEGEKLVRLMYAHAGELATLSRSDSRLRERLYSAAADLSRIAVNYLDEVYGPADVPVRREIAQELFSTIREVSKAGSPGLRKNLEYVSDVIGQIQGMPLNRVEELVFPSRNNGSKARERSTIGRAERSGS